MRDSLKRLFLIATIALSILSTQDVQAKNKWNITLSQYEKNILANIVWLEAGNQCNTGQQAIVEVVLNRIKHKSFPNTLTGVLSQNGQFSSYYYMYKARPTKRVKKNINKVLSGKTNVLNRKHLYFRTKFPHTNKNVTRIQDHYFSG